MAKKDNSIYWIIGAVIILLFLAKTGSSPSSSETVSLSTLAIQSYDVDEIPLTDTDTFSIVNGQRGIYYIDFTNVVTNVGTNLITCQLYDAKPVSLKSSLSKLGTFTVSPKASVKFTSNKITTSTFEPTTITAENSVNFYIQLKCSDSKGINYYPNGSVTLKFKKEDPNNKLSSTIVEVVNATSPAPTVPMNKITALGPNEQAFYNSYKTQFVKPNGAVISTLPNAPGCNSGGVGCGNQVTSEGVSALADYAVMIGDKDVFDMEVNYFQTTMKATDGGWMMWKLNLDGTPVLADGGQKAATDADIRFVNALIMADKKWGSNGVYNYKKIAQDLLVSLKAGLIQNQYLPYCMQYFGKAMPCENKIFLGYNNLNVLWNICQLDSSWCNTYYGTKNLMVNGIQNGGVNNVYNFDNGLYDNSQGYVHSNWVVRCLGTDPNSNDKSWNAVATLYNSNKASFYLNQQMCQDLIPGITCSPVNADMKVYVTYLDMASSKGDTQFRNDLIKFVENNRKYTPYAPLLSPWNYDNIETLEIYARARQAGAVIG